MAKVIGIDLGTSNSAAAVMEAGRPVIIPSAEGAGVASGKAFPSYVAFTKDGQRLVESRQGAKQRLMRKGQFKLRSVKWAQILNSKSWVKNTRHSRFLLLSCKR